MPINELRKLPLEQRLELVQDLWDSIVPEQVSIALTPAHQRELDRRMAAYIRDGEVGQPAEEVLAELYQRL